MTDLSYSDLPVAGETNNASDVITPLNEIKAHVNSAGWVTDTNLESHAARENLATGGDAAILGLSSSGSVRRGKSIIATEESVTSTSYTTLTTPDQVSSVVVPTDGVLYVLFRADWKNSVASNGKAAIFIGSNQLLVGGGAGLAQEATCTSSTSGYTQLVSTSDGLASPSGYNNDARSTTGQTIATSTINTAGGVICAIEVAAGTYTVSVKYKSASGSVTARNRKLWVWTQGF